MLAGDPEWSADELRQGDILERNDHLKEAIRQAHQYYSDEATDYEYFMVLTPTCELVCRDGKCSSRYITLAAVRPLSTLVNRELENLTKSVKAPGVFCRKDRKPRAKQFAERLLHNTEEGYFFLPGEFFPDDTHRAAFLKLSIALRAGHYEACLKAKVKQLAVDCSAKVGLLAANLYGQIATQAIEEQADINPEQIKDEFFRRTLEADGIHWISVEQHRVLKKMVADLKAAVQRELTPEDVSGLVEKLPTDKELLAARAVELLRKAGSDDDALISTFQNMFVSDQIVSRFVPE